MPPRAKKKQRCCARSRPAEVQVGLLADEDAPDWVNAVFGHPDVGPLVLAHIDDLKDVAHFRRVCKLMHAKDTIFANATRIFKSHDPHSQTGHPHSVTRHACFHGDLRLVRFLHEHVTAATGGCAVTAALCGHMDVLVYLHSIGVAMDMEVSAAAGTHHTKGLEMLKWLQAHDVPWDETVLVAVLRGGGIYADEEGAVAILQYVFAREFAMTGGVEFRLRPDFASWRLTECVKDAARAGSIACIKVLTAHGGHSSLGACRAAVEHGHVDTLKYLSTEVMDILAARSGCSLLVEAIKGDQLECFKYLYPLCAAYMDNNGMLLVEYAFTYGRSAILRYMIDTEGVAYTQENVKYLLLRDGNDKAIVMMAKEYGHRFTVQDLRESMMLKHVKNYKALHSKLRIPWTNDTLHFCAVNNYTEGFMYALEHGAKVDQPLLQRCCMLGGEYEVEALVKYHNLKPDADCMYALAKQGLSCLGIFLVAWMSNKKWKTAMERQLLLARPTTKAEKADHGPPYAKFLMDVFNRRIQV
jgi:hypothetical protein